MRASESRNAPRGVGEQQVRLVEEHDELGLGQVAGLGQRLEQLGDEPHQRRRPQLGLVLHLGQLDAGDHAAAVGRDPQQIGDVELRLAEELDPAAGLQADERAQQHPHGLRRQAADALELGLAGVGVEEGEQRAQVGEVEQRQPLAVGVVEHQPERGLLGLVGAQHLGEELRAEVDTVARTGTPGPSPPRARNSTGKAVGANGSPRSAIRFSPGPPARPPTASPETSPLTSATSTGTPARESCSVTTCSVFVLPVPVAPATSPCRFIVASGMRTAASRWSVRRLVHGAARGRSATPSVAYREANCTVGASRVARRACSARCAAVAWCARLHALRLSSTTLRSRTRRRHLDALVLAQELERLVERELPVGHEPHEHLGGRRADVGQVLLLRGVDVEVVGARVLAHDHALVDLLARTDEQRPALLQVHQRELGRRAAAVGDQRAGRAACAARPPTAPSGRRRGAAGRCRASR